MTRKPRIAIVGPGRLGSTLAQALRRAGYPITEIISRNNTGSKAKARQLACRVGSHTSTGEGAQLGADLVWFCVPDRQIASAAHQFAARTDWKGKTAFHSSGALASSELEALRKLRASVASIHPLMTFVHGSAPSLSEVPFALEGDAAAIRMARRIVRDLGGKAFTINNQLKTAYHAWGAFASPLLVATLVTAEQVARAAGLSAVQARKKMLPIVKQTIANYEALGAAGAFSGPIVRGDAEVVRQHLQVLRKDPEARSVYLALARAAMKNLPVRNRKKLQNLLKQGA